MARNYHEIAFTESVKAQQEKYGTRKHYEKSEKYERGTELSFQEADYCGTRRILSRNGRRKRFSVYSISRRRKRFSKSFGFQNSRLRRFSRQFAVYFGWKFVGK
jgi:hypothetical protein